VRRALVIVTVLRRLSEIILAVGIIGGLAFESAFHGRAFLDAIWVTSGLMLVLAVTEFCFTILAAIETRRKNATEHAIGGLPLGLSEYWRTSLWLAVGASLAGLLSMILIIVSYAQFRYVSLLLMTVTVGSLLTVRRRSHMGSRRDKGE
jgi:hypothetical protein